MATWPHVNRGAQALSRAGSDEVAERQARTEKRLSLQTRHLLSMTRDHGCRTIFSNA